MFNKGIDEAEVSLFGGGGETGESFPGLFTSGGFVTAGDFASDDGRAKRPFGTIVGGLGGGVVETAQQMGALFFQSFLDGEIPGLTRYFGQESISPTLQLRDQSRQVVRARGFHQQAVSGYDRFEEKTPLI